MSSITLMASGEGGVRTGVVLGVVPGCTYAGALPIDHFENVILRISVTVGLNSQVSRSTRAAIPAPRPARASR